MRPSRAQVCAEFSNFLREGKRRRPRKALSVWESIARAWSGFHGVLSEKEIYTKTLEEYDAVPPRQRSRIRVDPKTKQALLQTKKALLRSRLQDLDRLANEWPGFVWDNQAYGIKIFVRTGSIGLLVTECKPMKSNPEAETVVRSFYGAINQRDFAAAWNMLNPSYQESRWSGRSQRFIEGYKTFIAIEGLQIVLRTTGQAHAVFDVYYDEKQYPPYIPEFRDIAAMTVGEIGALSSSIADLESVLAVLGGASDRLRSLPMSYLFRADAPIAIPWELEIPVETVKKKYRQEEVTLSRGHRITLIQDNRLWRINRIGWL